MLEVYYKMYLWIVIYGLRGNFTVGDGHRLLGKGG